MIKTKEDLKGTFIFTEDKVLELKYLKLCERLGIKWVSGMNALKGAGRYKYIGMSTLNSSAMMICNDPRGHLQLTLSDFEEEESYQPASIKYRYVEVAVESIFHMQEALNNGSLVFGDQKKPVQNEWSLMKLLVEGKHKIYLKEEIKWQEEVLTYLKKPSVEGFEEELPSKFRVDYMDEGFHLVDSEFLEMCRVALRATGELK